MKKAIFIILTILIGYAFVTAVNGSRKQEVVPTPTAIVTIAPTSAPMIELINEERVKAGVPEVTYYEPLSKSAKIKACDMAENDYFSHEDQQGRMSWYLIDAFLGAEGFEYEHAGENLARNYTITEETMDAFMASPTHRDNILSEKYTRVGYATCGLYTVQHFASLK